MPSVMVNIYHRPTKKWVGPFRFEPEARWAAERCDALDCHVDQVGRIVASRGAKMEECSIVRVGEELPASAMR